MIKIAICDDEKKYRDEIESFFIKYKEDYLVESYDRVSAISDAEILDVDIFFLDIEIGEDNGISFARKIKAIKNESVIIFITNHVSYISEAFQVNAFQYILKPIDKKKLQSELARAVLHIQLNYKKILFYGNEDHVIECKNILYIENSYASKRVFVTLVSGEKLVCNNKFVDLLSQMSSHSFCRTHNSFIVSLDNIRKIAYESVIMVDGQEIPISRKYGKNFKEMHRIFVSGVRL